MIKTYTYSDARQRFSKVLETASKEGKVLIRRRDGSLFSLIPEPEPSSPFDIEGISVSVSTADIVDTLRAGRERTPLDN